jgi:hypothetical protein
MIVQRFGQLLSDDEHVRAKRFHFETDRQHFIVARGYLRMLISRYQETPPAEIKFTYGAHGRPQLVTSTAQALPFNFNLAHSGGLALYAFTRVVLTWNSFDPNSLGTILRSVFFSSGVRLPKRTLSRIAPQGFLQLLDSQVSFHQGDRHRIVIAS